MNTVHKFRNPNNWPCSALHTRLPSRYFLVFLSLSEESLRMENVLGPLGSFTRCLALSTSGALEAGTLKHLTHTACMHEISGAPSFSWEWKRLGFFFSLVLSPLLVGEDRSEQQQQHQGEQASKARALTRRASPFTSTIWLIQFISNVIPLWKKRGSLLSLSPF